MTPDLARRFLDALPAIADAVEDYWRNYDREDELRDLLLEIRAVAEGVVNAGPDNIHPFQRRTVCSECDGPVVTGNVGPQKCINCIDGPKE